MTDAFPAVTGSISFAPGLHIPDKEVTIVRAEAGQLKLAIVRPRQVPNPWRRAARGLPGWENRLMARYGAALFWIVAGTLHFVIPRQYEAIVPPYLARWKRELVVASGVAELAGGVAVLPERSRRGARWWLLATLVAVYPANIHMAMHPEDFPKIPRAALWARLPVQGLFALLTWRGTH